MLKERKVLITAPYIEQGGVASFVSNITPFFNPKPKVFRRGNNPNTSSIWNKIKMLLLPFTYLLSIVNSRAEVSIVNTSLSKTCLLRDGLIVFISKILNRKVLLIIHGFEEKALNHKFLLENGYFKADSIIVLSSDFKRQILQAGYKKPVYLNYNPVSIDILKNTSGVKTDKITHILFLSRIEKEKGIITCLEAFRLAQNSCPSIKLTVAGSGSALNSAKNYVKGNNIQNVQFTGFISGEAKIDILKEADVLLFPTYKEGLPINVLEAMAAGQIIITRPVGGLKDLYKTIDFGYLVESLAAERYVEILENLIKHPDEFNEKRSSNRAFAIEHFHPQQITNIIERIIQDF